MKKYYKYIILLIMVLVSFTTVNVDAAIGYTYSHSGQPIYSSVGLSVTSDGIYTVISDAWKNAEGERLPATQFKSPEDLFVYTDTDEDGNKNDVIYVVDSNSNNLFVFDGNLNYQERHNKFEIKPENFTEAEILPIKTGKMDVDQKDGSVTLTTSIGFTDYLSSKGYTLAQFFAVGNIPYEERTEDEKFYISGNGLSGVYRS